jgi:hypothetical protein
VPPLYRSTAHTVADVFRDSFKALHQEFTNTFEGVCPEVYWAKLNIALPSLFLPFVQVVIKLMLLTIALLKLCSQSLRKRDVARNELLLTVIFLVGYC